MDPVLQSIEEYIKSKEYFIDARKWYMEKYLYPFVERSILLITGIVLIVLLIGVSLQLNALFPIIKHVRYSIYGTNTFTKVANVKPLNQSDGSPLMSIAHIMLENYILQRESYDYDKLKQQFEYMQNASTKIVFRKFYNYMSLDNSLSPVMRYQKYTRRSVKNISLDNIDGNSATVNFESLAKSTSGEILENMLWQATINYAIDKINIKLSPNSKFNFVVTGYKTQLIHDKLNK